MATKEKDTNKELEVEEIVSRSEQFIENNSKKIIYGIIAVALVVGAVLGIKHGYLVPQEKKAAAAMQTDPRYLALDQARKANDKDEELQNLIGEFNLKRLDLNNESAKPEPDTAHVAELNQQVNDLYTQIMSSEGMVRYNTAKKECEAMVSHIDAIINTAMNGGDPMTVQEPSASCTGSCSTCGGCH